MNRRLRKQLPLLFGMGSVLSILTVGLGYVGLQTYGRATADEYGCYVDAPQRSTFVLVDASEPRFNEEQARSLRSYFDQLYDGLAFNERLSIFTSEGDQVASIARSRFSLCGQARTPDELKAINASAAEAGYLRKQRQRLYEKKLAPELDALFADNLNESRRQLYQSPILEMIGDISRSPQLNPGSRLVVVSDFIQNSDSARFCRAKGHMPRFSNFKKRSVYTRLKPSSLEDVEVKLLMVQRHGYGRGSLAYCYSEEELRKWWVDYLKDNGVRNPRIIRIRHGATGS